MLLIRKQDSSRCLKWWSGISVCLDLSGESGLATDGFALAWHPFILCPIAFCNRLCESLWSELERKTLIWPDSRAIR